MILLFISILASNLFYHTDQAKKKAEQALRESLEQELAAAGGDQKPAAKQEESDISEV